MGNHGLLAAVPSSSGGGGLDLPPPSNVNVEGTPRKSVSWKHGNDLLDSPSDLSAMTSSYGRESTAPQMPHHHWEFDVGVGRNALAVDSELRPQRGGGTVAR